MASRLFTRTPARPRHQCADANLELRLNSKRDRRPVGCRTHALRTTHACAGCGVTARHFAHGVDLADYAKHAEARRGAARQPALDTEALARPWRTARIGRTIKVHRNHSSTDRDRDSDARTRDHSPEQTRSVVCGGPRPADRHASVRLERPARLDLLRLSTCPRRWWHLADSTPRSLHRHPARSLGPLLALGSYLCLRDIIRQKKWLVAGLTLFFIFPFCITALLSGGGSLPHWTAPAWLAIIPFAANAIGAHWASGKQFWIRAFIRLQVAICLLAFVLLFFVGIPGITQDHPWGKKNPLADMWGWDSAGALAQTLSHKHNIPSVSVRNWTLASRMAWYAKPLVTFVLDKRFDQFDLWFGEIPAGADSLFVNWSQMRFDLPTQPGGFESCTLVKQLDITRLGRLISDFKFYHCRNWGAAPNPK